MAKRGGKRHGPEQIVQMLSNSESEVRRVAEFLDGRPAVDRMLQAIDPALYRNRSANENTHSG